jgi:hypothetical protein
MWRRCWAAIEACTTATGGAASSAVRLIDYLRGKPLALVSDLAPELVAARLDAAIDSMWAPFATGVIGWVGYGRFALLRRDSLWLQTAHLPVLAGRIRPEGAGSRITARYRAPRPIQLLFLLSQALLLYLATALLGYAPALPWPLVPVAAIAVLVPVSSLLPLPGEGDDILGELRAVLEEAAGGPA